MARINTAYVSAYQLDRIKQIDLYANAKTTLTCEWRGVLDGRTITASTWYADQPWSVVMSSPVRNATSTEVDLQAALPAESLVKCEITLSDGSVLNQFWRVCVWNSPIMGQIANQGPEQVSA